ncbi:hypothetical protein KIN20_022656 [Parelaphostrongylus tenuis]|uniref:GAR domain-containing protein n=1 Tax=Parelaphostrongylus tenuis TaxID=148309 RepID=A0AAD5N5S3_PARTN|nr:hypothetical protein KIN20_022656 [Parelaphostrongylus tenuis]
MDDVSFRKRLMAEQQAAGTRIQYNCEKKDAIPIKNGLISLKHRFEKVSNRTADRCKQIKAALNESRAWVEGVDDLKSWLENIESNILKEQCCTNNVDKLRKRLDLIKHVQEDLAVRKHDFDIAYKQGRGLIDHAPRSEVKQISQWNDDLMKRWISVVEKANDTYIITEQGILDSSAFDEYILELESSIDAELSAIGTAESRVAEAELRAKEVALRTVFSKGEKLSAKIPDESHNINKTCSRVKEKWSRLEEAYRASSKAIDDAAKQAAHFDSQLHEVLDWLVEIENKLTASNTDLDQAFSIVENIKVELLNNREKRDSCLQLGREIQARCHPRAEQTLKYWIRVIENRWKEVEERVLERESNLLQQQQQEKEREEALFELLEFVAQKREELNKVLVEALPQDLETMDRVQQSHNDFDSKLREKQAVVDNITKHNRKGKRNAAVGKLSDEWKQLWLDSIGYQTALEGQRELLEEMRRLERWRWESWKEHYVEWNDHRKARVTDLFRRMDRSHTGNVPREFFIDGILASKFPTSRLEMNKVADLFDKGDGLINSKEFIDALRFDRIRELKPLTEHEKVNEEITKQKNACSCCQQFKIEKVADGHYRFGDTQIKRMVRILRSTVMVRVGGGWEALDVFLSKHDPCRTRGRLNIEMFYKDVAPSNAIDTMRAFTKVRHRNTPGRNATSGPVMKVREKTERSIPMFTDRRDTRENQMDLFMECRDSVITPSSRPGSRASGSTADEKSTRMSSVRKIQHDEYSSNN